MQEDQTPVVQVEPVKQSNFLVVLLSVLLFLSVAIAGFFAYQTQKLVKELTLLRTEPTPIATSESVVFPELTFEQDKTLDPTANWKTYLNNNYEFKYPNNYSLSGLGVMSPLNTNRNQKDLTVQAGELKLEIYEQNFTSTMSVESCWNDNTSGSGKIIGRSKENITGTELETIIWEGEGTGEFTCVKHNNKRYLINKYPAETSRQSEYIKILSTFKFIN